MLLRKLLGGAQCFLLFFHSVFLWDLVLVLVLVLVLTLVVCVFALVFFVSLFLCSFFVFAVKFVDQKCALVEGRKCVRRERG